MLRRPTRHAVFPDDNAVDDVERSIAHGLEADPAYAAARQDALARDEFYSHLAAARDRAGLSQAVVAERMGTSQSVVSEIENGVTDSRLTTLQRFARAVGAELVVRLAEPASAASHTVTVTVTKIVSLEEYRAARAASVYAKGEERVVAPHPKSMAVVS